VSKEPPLPLPLPLPRPAVAASDHEAPYSPTSEIAYHRRVRAFAALYALFAVAAAAFPQHSDTLPWSAVCVAAAGLALVATLRKPLVLLNAAHAGLTATWAGTLAARQFRHVDHGLSQAPTLAVLLVMCAGMAVLIAANLRSAPPAGARMSPRR
jgi:hypothetical protein